MTANSAVNPQELNEWVNEVRVLATEAGRIEIADQYIGHLLSSSPQGNDGAWPAEPVRDLIETINSRDLENGLEIQVINSRGVTSRGTYDGGSQERDLANRYKSYADIVQDMWPSTGAMLNRLADNYMNHATMEDLSAGLSEDLGH
ncbi:hypothetical protein CCAX7_46570 [Capsulimonas corticalis]|uniref:Uncharacterized protein n=2 Tax=Capsulimonas corticalis TaxID=2219043 RepID=A0A402D574_9BACT|nr:hypothetical protein CCAX7_46570 [Capsulimonas corticalis]